jgi:hypothetical protein
MALEETKKILNRIRLRYGDYLQNARADIYPDYSEKGLQRGYSYKGLENSERDFIFYSVTELGEIVNGAEGAIKFDIENVFLTEKKAVKALKISKRNIEEVILKTIEIETKYKGIEHSTYPIQVCHNIHFEINEILNEIFESDEFIEFNEPGKISKLNTENIELKFLNHWRKKKNIYIIHLLAFLPFLLGCAYVIINKDNQDITGINKTILIVGGGIITIAFNLFFNNHNSFKDSFKLILKKSSKNLKEKEKESFLKSK